MAVTRSAAKKIEPVARNTSQMVTFVWEGNDKRGIKMKGEQQSKSMNLLRA
jgi:type IV pilus assembly protein PilC